MIHAASMTLDPATELGPAHLERAGNGTNAQRDGRWLVVALVALVGMALFGGVVTIIAMVAWALGS